MKKNPRISRNRLDYSLTIVNTSTQDTGLYTCIASAGGESDSANAELIVEGKLTCHLTYHKDSISILKSKRMGTFKGKDKNNNL